MRWIGHLDSEFSNEPAELDSSRRGAPQQRDPRAGTVASSAYVVQSGATLGSRRLPSGSIACPPGPVKLHVAGSHSWENAFLLLLAVAAVVMFLGEGVKTALEPLIPSSLSPVAAQAARPDHISVGCTEQDVRAIQGEPTGIRGSTWRYGESEVYFTGGRVTAWKSSRHHPLNTGTRGPARTGR